jgi:hypothetical protein
MQFAYQIDLWYADGNSVVKHLADIDDLIVARATYEAACKRWPGERVTLRQGTRIIEDSPPEPDRLRQRMTEGGDASAPAQARSSRAKQGRKR